MTLILMRTVSLLVGGSVTVIVIRTVSLLVGASVILLEKGRVPL